MYRIEKVAKKPTPSTALRMERAAERKAAKIATNVLLMDIFKDHPILVAGTKGPKSTEAFSSAIAEFNARRGEGEEEVNANDPAARRVFRARIYTLKAAIKKDLLKPEDERSFIKQHGWEDLAWLEKSEAEARDAPTRKRAASSTLAPSAALAMERAAARKAAKIASNVLLMSILKDLVAGRPGDFKRLTAIEWDSAIAEFNARRGEGEEEVNANDPAARLVFQNRVYTLKAAIKKDLLKPEDERSFIKQHGWEDLAWLEESEAEAHDVPCEPPRKRAAGPRGAFYDEGEENDKKRQRYVSESSGELNFDSIPIVSMDAEDVEDAIAVEVEFIDVPSKK